MAPSVEMASGLWPLAYGLCVPVALLFYGPWAPLGLSATSRGQWILYLQWGGVSSSNQNGVWEASILLVPSLLKQVRLCI